MGTNMLRELLRLIEEARKSGDTKSVNHLKTIYGDLQRIDLHTVTKLDFTKWLKAQFKAIEAAQEKAEKLGVNYEPDYDYLQVLANLEHNYALTQMDEHSIRDYFSKMVSDNPNLNKGQLMKALKDQYEGRYDGKLAAKIAGEFHKGS